MAEDTPEDKSGDKPARRPRKAAAPAAAKPPRKPRAAAAGAKPAPKAASKRAAKVLTGEGQGGGASGSPVTPEGAEAMANAGRPAPLFADGPRRISLALQGGGAHGAFTWGVLDRLLEEESLEIAAISGCSAGALNGAALKSGWATGGREGARATLDWLWEQMGAIPDLSVGHWMMTFLPGPAMTAKMLEAMFPFPIFEAMTTAVSPYDLPMWQNPLEKVVDAFAWDKVCAKDGPRFFVSATNVRTGKIRVFTDGEVDTQVILASACLPTLFKAIEIPDAVTGRTEAYWDGGYAGNPALFPLYDRDLPDDVVIVNINPLVREDIPVTAQEISNRVNEISFNASLLRELRAIGFVKRLIAEGIVAKGAMKDVRVHMIADDALMQSLSAMTKLLPTPTLLAQLKAAGREAAEAFLQKDARLIGETASVDIVKMFG